MMMLPLKQHRVMDNHPMVAIITITVATPIMVTTMESIMVTTMVTTMDTTTG